MGGYGCRPDGCRRLAPVWACELKETEQPLTFWGLHNATIIEKVNLFARVLSHYGTREGLTVPYRTVPASSIATDATPASRGAYLRGLGLQFSSV